MSKQISSGHEPIATIAKRRDDSAAGGGSAP